MSHINKESYMAYSLAFKPEEIQLRDEFEAWLPDDIIDCHAHSNLPEHVEDMGDKTYRHMLSTFPSLSLEESVRLRGLFYPAKRIRSLRFASTFRGINHRQANSYLLEQSPTDDRVALFGLPEDIDYTTKMLKHPRVSALKMYYSYVQPEAETIYEYFKPNILEVAQLLDIPIILHLPKVITRSIKDLRQMIRDFPRLRIVIAHIGLSKMPIPGLKDAFDELVPFENVVFDTALNPSAEVASLALKTVGAERVLFGSDEPLNLIRSKAYIHPVKGQRLITEYPYHWVDPVEHLEFHHLATGLVHSHWAVLQAIRTGIELLPRRNRDKAKGKVFCENAREFFSF